MMIQKVNIRSGFSFCSVALRRGKQLIASILAVAAAAELLHPVSAQACAACYGQSDAPIARGMNWGILSLLGMVGVVLGILSAFFVFLARKAGEVPAVPTGAPTIEPTENIET
jgi:hypothetical protein